MIHGHNLQNLLLGGPRTQPGLPVIVELLDEAGKPLVHLPVLAVRIGKTEAGEAYIVSAEASGLIMGLADRVTAQSEILSKRAEKPAV